MSTHHKLNQLRIELNRDIIDPTIAGNRRCRSSSYIMYVIVSCRFHLHSTGVYCSALKRNKTGEEKEADRRRKGNLPALADAVR